MLCIIENHSIHKIIYRFVKRIRRSNYCSTCQLNNSDTNASYKEDNSVNICKENKKSLKIAMLGAPNAGKSTLVNRLINRSVCPTSAKVHTTEVKSDAVYCQNVTQLIFIDTPGLVTLHECNKYKLADTFKKDPQKSIKIADVIGLIQDVGNRWTRDTIPEYIVKLLQEAREDAALLLILNKVDQLRKKHLLLPLVRKFTSKDFQLKFTDIFMISALTGDGVENLRNYLLDCAKLQDWQYEKNIYTNQTPELVIIKTVRAQLMDALPNEIPYRLNLQLEHFEICTDKSVSAYIIIQCPSERICRVVLTRAGRRIREIAQLCEQRLQHAFRTPVRLKLCVVASEKK